MKFVLPAVAALSLMLTPFMAEAKPGNGGGKGHGARAEQGRCPPGLAKRNPACVPPGQVGRDNRENRRPAPKEEPDRDVARDEDTVQPPEPDPVAVLLQLLDEIPTRDVEPPDEAQVDMPLEPAPVAAPIMEAPVPRAVDLQPEPTTVAPVADTESDLGEVFRRANAEGSVGY